MIIKVDTREHDLLQQINILTANIPIFKDIVIKSETLPLGDIIICDDKEEKLVIERKSVTDLLASIKDGRYEEQSYRLNGLNHHNHNIIYLIEGDVNRVNRFKTDNRVEKLTLYSAMFSLNYYKGFSVFRSFSLEETATIICNMAYKLKKDPTKKAFFTNTNALRTIPEATKVTNEHMIVVETQTMNDEATNEAKEDQATTKEDQETTKEDQATTKEHQATTKEHQETTKEEPTKEDQSDKDYVSVIKKVKKENITPENIGEIMLCQIPGISSVTALAIMAKFKTLQNLIKELENNNDCLKDITSTNAKGQTRRINKTSIANIVKFLLKK
jgi:ERCC4-type nuclease